MSTPLEIQGGRVFSADQVLLPHISYQSFIYPGDEEALAALTKVPGASSLLIYLQKHFTEGLTFLENNEQKIRAGDRSYASLYKLVTRCAEILSCPVPEVYVTTNPTLGAYTVGHRRTSIVLHSSLVESLTADELSFVIGHELGHIKCGHGLYRQLGALLLRTGMLPRLLSRYLELVCSAFPCSSPIGSGIVEPSSPATEPVYCAFRPSTQG